MADCIVEYSDGTSSLLSQYEPSIAVPPHSPLQSCSQAEAPVVPPTQPPQLSVVALPSHSPAQSSVFPSQSQASSAIPSPHHGSKPLLPNPLLRNQNNRLLMLIQRNTDTMQSRPVH